MRKWKDNETIKIKYRWLYTAGSIFMMFMATLNFLFFKWNWQDILNFGLGAFLMWGIWMNGLYKIMRKITEIRLRRKDNKFDYFHT